MEVLTRAELLERVGGRAALDRALAEGQWQRVLRGAYAPGGVVPDLAVRAAAARQVLPASALVADRCLLWVLGADVLPSGPPVLEVVVPRGVSVPRRSGVRARVADLPPRDCWTYRGLPVLRPARAVVDLLRALPTVEAVVAADAALHAGLCTPAQLAAELAAHAGRRGVRQAREALTLADGRAEAPPETRLRLLLVGGGLRPVPQHVVHDSAGHFVARVDLALVAERVAVEYDGREAHLAGPAFVRERRRQNALLASGWLVLRYTAADLAHRPHEVVAEVARAASVRAAA